MTDAHIPSPFFEDVEIGRSETSAGYLLEQDEIRDFARRWDPVPIHIDADAADRSIFGGLTASSAHLLAIKQLLVQQLPLAKNAICTLGFEALKFRNPGRPGDSVSLRALCEDKRLSASRPAYGIVRWRLSLRNQDGLVILDHLDTVLMRRRPA